MSQDIVNCELSDTVFAFWKLMIRLLPKCKSSGVRNVIVKYLWVSFSRGGVRGRGRGDARVAHLTENLPRYGCGRRAGVRLQDGRGHWGCRCRGRSRTAGWRRGDAWETRWVNSVHTNQLRHSDNAKEISIKDILCGYWDHKYCKWNGCENPREILTVGYLRWVAEYHYWSITLVVGSHCPIPRPMQTGKSRLYGIV